MATIVQGVRARYESAGSTSNTLEGLLKSERLESQDHATGCLVRLIRCVYFYSSAKVPFISYPY